VILRPDWVAWLSAHAAQTNTADEGGKIGRQLVWDLCSRSSAGGGEDSVAPDQGRSVSTGNPRQAIAPPTNTTRRRVASGNPA